MVVVDLNVLVYATNKDSARHVEARDWLERALNGAEGVGLAWLVLVGFVRLATRPQVFPAPLSLAEATGQVRAWLDADPAAVVEPGPRHLGLLTELLDGAGTAGNLVNDAHLAALALERGARVATFDRDFARFAGLGLEVVGG